MKDFSTKSSIELEGIIYMSGIVSKQFAVGAAGLLLLYLAVKFRGFIQESDLPELISMDVFLFVNMFCLIFSAYMAGFFFINCKRAGKALAAKPAVGAKC